MIKFLKEIKITPSGQYFKAFSFSSYAVDGGEIYGTMKNIDPTWDRFYSTALYNEKENKYLIFSGRDERYLKDIKDYCIKYGIMSNIAGDAIEIPGDYVLAKNAY